MIGWNVRLKIIRSAFHYGIFITIFLSSNHDILISEEEQLINNRVKQDIFSVFVKRIFYGPFLEKVSHSSVMRY